MDDLQIIELYFARSEEAIRETAGKYGAYLEQVVYHILRSREDCEEIVNDTYMGAWNAIPPERPRSLKHFLSKIARNLSFNRLDYRMAGKRNAIVTELDECIPDEKGSVERAWEAKEIAEVLNTFLGTLDDRTCAVFLTRYYYACTVREIAERYGQSERQVKYTLTKTRQQLKRALERAGFGGGT